MTDNNDAHLSGSTDGRSPAKKLHALKIKKMLLLRAKYRRQRHRDQIKKRKHASLIHAFKSGAIPHHVNSKPACKTNIHSLFYVKPLRDAHLAAMKSINGHFK